VTINRKALSNMAIETRPLSRPSSPSPKRRSPRESPPHDHPRADQAAGKQDLSSARTHPSPQGGERHTPQRTGICPATDEGSWKRWSTVSRPTSGRLNQSLSARCIPWTIWRKAPHDKESRTRDGPTPGRGSHCRRSPAAEGPGAGKGRTGHLLDPDGETPAQNRSPGNLLRNPIR